MADHSYNLKVDAPGYTSVEASCKVPILNNQSLHLLSFDSISGNQNSVEYKFKVEFTDFSGIGNYYRIGGDLKVLYDSSMGMSADTGYNALSAKLNQEFLTDKVADGQKMLSELNYNKYNNEFGYGGEKLIGLKLVLLTTDENYYKYHKSLSGYVGDDPFSEPTIVYSNIHNGLGVFAAYRKYTVNVNFPN